MEQLRKTGRTFNHWLDENLLRSGADGDLLTFIKISLLLVALIIICVLAYYITQKLIRTYVHRFFLHTKATWDDILVQKGVFSRLSHLAPAIILKAAIPYVYYDVPRFIPVAERLTDVYIIVVVAIVAVAILETFRQFLKESPLFRDKPIDSYFQLAKIILYIAIFILALSLLLNRSPLVFLSAFGAMTAVLLLIFRDTILGLVASVQISSLDMVRVGDWVEMSKYGADGDVITINLTTVKIRNFDKTYTNVPTYAFISDSFKNWRGMQESGGRRIKRQIHIKIGSVKFLDAETTGRFKKYQCIKDYVENRQKEIEEYNQKTRADKSVLINGRHMTNIGVYRRYAEAYLNQHPNISKELTIMVRQLQPEANGLPIEIYCFTNTVVWTEFEGIQSDIFDHLIAAAEYFDLEIFQSPTGFDIQKIGEKLALTKS